jgi:hypothetical protein
VKNCWFQSLLFQTHLAYGYSPDPRLTAAEAVGRLGLGSLSAMSTSSTSRSSSTRSVHSVHSVGLFVPGNGGALHVEFI